LPCPHFSAILKQEVVKMAVYIKPVQPTVIKDKKIIRDIIAQIRRKPAPEDIKRAKARRDLFKELTAK
jgi:hypothetical protein